MGYATGQELWAWRQQMRQKTLEQGIDPQALDWLLGWVTDVDGLTLKLGLLPQRPAVHLGLTLPALTHLWQRRLQERVPVQYLVGKTTWRQFTLQVSPAVLIPRPETELMIDLVAAAVASSPQGEQLRQGTWVDMGTGSGAIALALALVFPLAQIVAVDLSAAALALAQQNALANHLAHRITFCQGSWFEPLAPWQGSISGLVSNPPYIPTATLDTLQPEVIHHEPVTALDGGADGLDAIRILARQAPGYLVEGGFWGVEMMAGQGAEVAAILTEGQRYGNIQIHPDLAGHDRFGLAFCIHRAS